MLRKFDKFESFLSELEQDTYPQPSDPGHYQWAYEFIEFMDEKLNLEGRNVLDVGCGVGFVYSIFVHFGVSSYYGITMTSDDIAQSSNKEVLHLGDFHFVNNSVKKDIIFSRHSLEHSPMPLLALMEWNRVCEEGGYLCLVVPNPDHFGYIHRNHYSVTNREQLGFWLRRAGWGIMFEQPSQEEIRLICYKTDRKIPFYDGVNER